MVNSIITGLPERRLSNTKMKVAMTCITRCVSVTLLTRHTTRVGLTLNVK